MTSSGIYSNFCDIFVIANGFESFWFDDPWTHYCRIISEHCN